MSESSGPVQGSTSVRAAADGRTAARRSGGLRWGVALVAVAVIVGGLGTLGALVATPTPPDAITYVPSGSLAVMEVRPDLPGDQRDSLGAVLLRIPGFADVASLNERVNAALDEAVRRATDGARTWSTDVQPYAAGAAVMAMLPPGEGEPATAGPRGLVVLTTQGSPGCAPLEGDRQVTVERYRDTDIRTTTPQPTAAPTVTPSGSGGPGSRLGGDLRLADRPMACADTGRFVLLGDASAIRAALDAKAQGRSVAGDNGYGAAFRALPDAHAAWGYLNTRAIAGLAGSLPLPSGLPIPSAARSSLPAIADLPEWAAMEVRFTSTGMVIGAVMPDRRQAILAALPAPSGAADRTPVPAASSALAPALPSSTVALLESHDLGTLLDAVSSGGTAGQPGGSPMASFAPSLGGALGALSLAPQLLGEAGQAGAVVITTGESLAAGLVVQLRDGAVARSALDQLRLLGGMLGGVTSTDYRGTPILSVPVSSLAALAGGADGSGGAGGLPSFPGLGGLSGASPRPSGTTPALPSLPTAADALVLSVAVHGNILVVGLGDALARAIIDTPAGSSLADQPGYQSAMAAAGTPNLGSIYVDLGALRSAGTRMGPRASATPAASAHPVGQALGVAAGSVTSADGLLRGRLVITVR